MIESVGRKGKEDAIHDPIRRTAGFSSFAIRRMSGDAKTAVYICT